MSESNFPSTHGYAFLPSDAAAADDPVALRAALTAILGQTMFRTQPGSRDNYVAHVAGSALRGKDWRDGYAPRMASHRRLARALIHRLGGQDASRSSRAEVAKWILDGRVPTEQTGSVPAKEQGNG